MKHTIIILTVAIMSMMALESRAQGLVYRPFIPEQSSTSYESGSWSVGSGSTNSRARGYQPKSQTQTIRTTAYYIDYSGYYVKVPIRLEYTEYSNGASTINLSEQWESNGMGGQWRKVHTASNVVSCQPITANGTNAELERSFMYKVMVGAKWYYFDL